jgi:hypothetical protein
MSLDSHITAGAALTRCLRCRYSLRGLPTDHTCPECGLRFDSKSRVWRVRRNKAVFLPLIWLVGGASFFIHAIGRIVSGIHRARWIAILTGSVVIIGIAVKGLVKLYWHGQFVALLPEFLVDGTRRGAPAYISWSNVVRVSLATGKVGAVVVLRRELEVRDMVGAFRTKTSAEEFVDAAQERIQPARAPSAG